MNLNWRKASFSGDQGNCIEVASADGNVYVRDTKQDGRGPMLAVSRVKFAAFVTEIKAGRHQGRLETRASGEVRPAA